MTLEQLLTDNTWAEITTIKNRYPNFMNYVVKRFGSYNSRYEKNVFQNLWVSLILNNQAELAFAETLNEQTNTKLSPDKLGDVVEARNENTSNRDNQNIASYKGYDVEGDYSKNKHSGTATLNSNTKTQSINYFEYLSNINNSRFRNTWKHIVRQIMNLCVTIIPIN